MIVYNETKYRHLAERAHQANLAVSDLNDRIKRARDEIQEREAHRNKQLRRQRPTDEDQQRFERNMQPLRDELAFCEAELQRAQHQQQLIAPIVSRCDAWLREQRFEGQVEADPEATAAEAIDAKKGRANLDKVRDQIADAYARRDALAATALPVDEALAKVEEFVNGAAASFSSGDALVAQAIAPDRRIDSMVFSLPVRDGTDANLTPMLCWLYGDAIKAKARTEIERRAAPEQTISGAERAQQLAAIDDELEQLGRDEEQLVASLEAAGEIVDRRDDADPAIILEAREVADRDLGENRPEPSPYKSRQSIEIERSDRGRMTDNWADDAGDPLSGYGGKHPIGEMTGE